MAWYPETLERYADFHLVSALDQPTLRLEHVVGREVSAFPRLGAATAKSTASDIAAFYQHAVALHAERVDREHESLAAVIERADEQLHYVVGKDPVPVGERGVHFPREARGANAEIDRGGRVPDSYFGRVDRRLAIDRLEVRETGEAAAPCQTSSSRTPSITT